MEERSDEQKELAMISCRPKKFLPSAVHHFAPPSPSLPLPPPLPPHLLRQCRPTWNQRADPIPQRLRGSGMPAPSWGREQPRRGAEEQRATAEEWEWQNCQSYQNQSPPNQSHRGRRWQGGEPYFGWSWQSSNRELCKQRPTWEQHRDGRREIRKNMIKS